MLDRCEASNGYAPFSGKEWVSTTFEHILQRTLAYLLITLVFLKPNNEKSTHEATMAAYFLIDFMHTRKRFACLKRKVKTCIQSSWAWLGCVHVHMHAHEREFKK